MMVRFLSCLFISVSMSLTADAALLTYKFTNTMSASDVDFHAVSQDSTRSGFILTSTDLQSSTSGATVRAYIGAKPISTVFVDSVSFDGKRSGGAVVNWTLSLYDVWSATTPGAGNLIGTATGTFVQQVGYVVPFTTPGLGGTYRIDPNARMMAVLTFTKDPASSGSFPSIFLDNLSFNGSAVPEPASMAVFGVLGLGLVVRRLRQRS
jgi:hypothetical protein